MEGKYGKVAWGQIVYSPFFFFLSESLPLDCQRIPMCTILNALLS